jgi:hypothetical protein
LPWALKKEILKGNAANPPKITLINTPNNATATIPAMNKEGFEQDPDHISNPLRVFVLWALFLLQMSGQMLMLFEKTL